KVELADHVPLICRPLRRWPGRDFCHVVLERKPLNLICGEGPRIQPDILITRILRRMLLGIAPPKLRRSASTNTRLSKVVLEHTCCDSNPIDEDLDAGCMSGTVVGEENMFPCVVEWEGLHSRDADGDLRSVIAWWIVGFRLLRFGFCCSLCL